MDIRDAMAEAIYKRVRECPGDFTKELVRQAGYVAEFYHTYPTTKNRNVYSASWHQFKRMIAELSPAVPENSPDKQPEDNGDGDPDARDFEK